MLPVITLAAFASILALRTADVRADVLPVYSVDFHTIGAGGAALHNNCFRLSATLAQAAPGYSVASSGSPIYSVYAGFWSAAAATSPDAIFFTAFEVC